MNDFSNLLLGASIGFNVCPLKPDILQQPFLAPKVAFIGFIGFLHYSTNY